MEKKYSLIAIFCLFVIFLKMVWWLLEDHTNVYRSGAKTLAVLRCQFELWIYIWEQRLVCQCMMKYEKVPTNMWLSFPILISTSNFHMKLWWKDWQGKMRLKISNSPFSRLWNFESSASKFRILQGETCAYLKKEQQRLCAPDLWIG